MRRQTLRRQTLRCLCLNKFNRFLARSANRVTNGVNQTRCWPMAAVLDAVLNSMKTPELLPLPQKRRTLPRFRGTSGSWSLRPPFTWDGVSSKACNPSSETGFLTARYGGTAAINHPKILGIRAVRLGQAGSLVAVTRAVAQFGSASGWGSEGRRFKSFQPDQFTYVRTTDPQQGRGSSFLTPMLGKPYQYRLRSPNAALRPLYRSL